MFKTSGDVFSAEQKIPAGGHLARKGHVEFNEMIQNHKTNTSFDSLKAFSDSYLTIVDDL